MNAMQGVFDGCTCWHLTNWLTHQLANLCESLVTEGLSWLGVSSSEEKGTRDVSAIGFRTDCLCNCGIYVDSVYVERMNGVHRYLTRQTHAILG